MKKFLLYLVLLAGIFMASKLKAQPGQYYVVFTNLDEIGNSVTNYFSEYCYYFPLTQDQLTKPYVATSSFSKASFASKPITSYDVAVFPLGSHKLSDVVDGIRIWDKVEEMLNAKKGVLIYGSNYMADAINGASDISFFMQFTVGLEYKKTESLNDGNYLPLRIKGIHDDPMLQTKAFDILGNVTIVSDSKSYPPPSYYTQIETVTIKNDFYNTGGFQYIDTIGHLGNNTSYFANGIQPGTPEKPAWIGVHWQNDQAKLVMWTYSHAMIPGTEIPDDNQSTIQGVRWYIENAPRPEGFLQVRPGQISFGQVKPGIVSTLKASIVNFSREEVRVDSVAIEDFDGTKLFRIVGGGDPATLSPGDSIDVKISFQPKGPGDFDDFLDINSNSKNNKSLSVPLSGKGGNTVAGPYLQVSSDPVNFGSVKVGLFMKLPITVTNVGSAALVLNTVDFVEGSSASFSWDGPLGVPITIPGKTSKDILLRFTPLETELGKQTARIKFTSNGQNTDDNVIFGEGYVDVVGTAVKDGTKSKIQVSTDAISFGSVVAGGVTSLNKRFTIFNKGDANLLVSQIKLDGDAENMAQFSFSDSTDVVPNQNIAPNDKWEVLIKFKPLEALDYGLNVKIITNDPDNPVTLIPLTGTGIAPIKGLETDISSLDYGSVTAHTKRNVVVTNKSDHNINVTDISFTGENNIFVIAAGNPSTFTLAAGRSQTLSIEFLPWHLLTYSANMIITSDDDYKPVISLPITAVALDTIPGSVNYEQEIPGVFTMNVNPNPANSEASVVYTLQGTSAKQAKIYIVDILGNKVADLFTGNLLPGTYSTPINTIGISTGSYIILAEIGNQGVYQTLNVVK